ncbi:MAG: GDP-L-fucose synthase [Parvibaculum sp.]|nr:GDP-L-fucose synthase [Parvibaculum sp.]
MKGKSVWVAGHRGMVGSAIADRLGKEDCEILAVSRREVDLRRAEQVEAWMERMRPDAVVLAAARVGGIFANDSNPADFIYDNLMIEANVVDAARRFDVEKLVFLGSSCIYPRLAAQPISESALLSGPLEKTNEWYAIAKISGVKLCQAYRRQHGCDFISAMPTNLYGPRDNFDLMTSHVLPALIAKAHVAKEERAASLDVWGSGLPRREFLYVDDAADAVVHLMKHYSGEEHVNIGTGVDLPIADLAQLVCDVVGFRGALRFDVSKPDGTPRKLLDVSRIAELGWRPRVSLEEGIERTYLWYLQNQAGPRVRAHVEA